MSSENMLKHRKSVGAYRVSYCIIKDENSGVRVSYRLFYNSLGNYSDAPEGYAIS